MLHLCFIWCSNVTLLKNQNFHYLSSEYLFFGFIEKDGILQGLIMDCFSCRSYVFFWGGGLLSWVCWRQITSCCILVLFFNVDGSNLLTLLIWLITNSQLNSWSNLWLIYKYLAYLNIWTSVHIIAGQMTLEFP